MVTVSANLITAHLNEPKVEQMFGWLETDLKVRSNLRMSNVMAVERLKYNDMVRFTPKLFLEAS